ncbi:hypothetical protein BN946_scf184361.g8 [Trametes cinnabarina]|uniref:Calcofluor white hypersensitive protein n=1 Tax=Pycnoporus cinnabarinus TaxID=5643 RepID=A0A060SWA5_PYCCI|nr:hypothetical protein BN946_scf184361.g8 [Trametes cinnabarina]
MAPTVPKPKPPFVLQAATIARVHTALALVAFFGALLVGCALHYKKIVKNGVAGYPDEWFPSVSATIGDWYPERNVFQILIAINSGPRFALVALQYYLHHSPTSSIPGFLFLVGILRTLSCGGWVYITSSDDHDVHDVLMISYIVLNVPWMFGTLACTPHHNVASRRRRRLTSFAFFEWALIILDILYDSAAELDLQAADLKITVGSLAGSSNADKIVAPAKKASPLASISAVRSGHKEEHVERGSDKTASTSQVKPSSSLIDRARPSIAFVNDVYLSYIFWSVYTALAPTLFYFSVWELGISGQELALLSMLSPILLGIPPLRSWAKTREGRVVLHGLSLIGLAAASASIGVAVDWVQSEGREVTYQAIVTGLGFLVSSLSKHANDGNNPVWPFVDDRSGGYNKTGIALAVLAIYEFATRPALFAAAPETPEPAEPAEKSQAAASAQPQPHWLPASIALGGFIFTIHSLISDPSTLIAWSWTGYPIKGPIPNVHGSLTHVAQVLGLALAAFLSRPGFSSDVLAHPLWFAFGAGSACVMYSYKDWTGYAGGLGVAFFLMSIFPSLWAYVARAGKGRVARTLAMTWLVVCLYDVASTFTVAYAFVPGGEYFRERTDLTRSTLPHGTHFKTQYTLALLATLSLLATLWHSSWPRVVPRPHREAARIVRAGIWTVHFGIDNEGRDSQRRMRDLIQDMELDVVGLLETDLHRVVFGNRDLTRVIAEELGYYVDIGPGPNQHTWGAVLLSKFPILNSTHHLLPSPDGELAPAIEAILDMYGTEVKVVVSHNGQEETPLDRELQSTELARIMSESYPGPVIFLGYVVTKPHAPRPAPYDIMVTDGKVHDIDADDYDRWCEYIFYRGLYRTAYARVSRSTITDTELQIGQFVVPKPGEGVVDDSKEARYMRAWKEELAVDHWFPLEYYPEIGGKRGHFYHVFNTPLYYKIPPGASV